MKKSLRTVVFGVAIAFPGVAAAKMIVINTDSTVGGVTGVSAPPLPQAEGRGLEALPQPAKHEGENDLDWLIPGEGGSPSHEASAPSAHQAAPGSGREMGSTPTSVRSTVSGEHKAHPIATASQVEPVSALKPPEQVATPQKRWSLEVGLLKDQLVAWGREDILWDVVWEGSKDIEIEVSHQFYGEIDESVVAVVQALARSGVPIQLRRAKANHKLIIRSGE